MHFCFLSTVGQTLVGKINEVNILDTREWGEQPVLEEAVKINRF